MVIVVVILAFLFLSGEVQLPPQFQNRPAATGNPPPGTRVDPGAAGVAGGVDLVTGNYAGAANQVYNVFKNPAVQRNTATAAVGAFKEVVSAPAHAASSAVSTIGHTLSSLNPF